MNAIEVSHLSKQYGDFALRDVSFSLPEGTILGLVGENGAGKSTTIRAIMNALRRDGGQITVLGTDNQSKAFRDVKEDVGVVLDEAYYPEVLTAKNVGTVMAGTYRRWDAKCYQAYLKRFQLPTDKAFKDFSRGMKMKLAIAVALSHAPKLLILDEATSGLDPIVRDEILDLFLEFTREPDHSILLSSHIVSDLEKICDSIALMHGGRLMLCEEKDRLLETYAKVVLTREDAAAVNPSAMISRRDTPYGVEAVVRRGAVPTGFQTEHATLEEIILALVKGGASK